MSLVYRDGCLWKMAQALSIIDYLYLFYLYMAAYPLEGKMALSLFYDSLTRSGAIADITATGVVTKKVFPVGSFATWTHLVRIGSDLLQKDAKLFLYNQYTRQGVIAALTENEISITRQFPKDSFGAWTHIASVGSFLFFYDQNSRAGAVAATEPQKVKFDKKPVLIEEPNPAILDSIKDLAGKGDAPSPHLAPSASGQDFNTVLTFAPGSFSAWTDVVSCGPYLFFYNRHNAAGSLTQLHNEELSTVKDFAAGAKASLTSIQDFPPGSLGKWTHLVGAAPYLLFYNNESRSGRIVKISQAGLTTVKEFANGSFGVWTHVVGAERLVKPKLSKVTPIVGPNGIPLPQPQNLSENGAAVLFFNTHSGAGALGKLCDDQFNTVKTFADGDFGSWTSISDTAAALSPYDLGYTLTRSGSGLSLLSYSGEQAEVNNSGSNLSPQDQDKVIHMTYDGIKTFIHKNYEDIKNGKIKAADIGGELYGISATAVYLVIAPVLDQTLLGRIVGATFVDASKQVGRYYGAAVDELVSVLKGQSKPTITQVIATLGTMQFISTKLGAVMLSGDAWTLTKAVGMKLGEAAEDGLKTIAHVAGDVYGAGKDLVSGVYHTVTDFFGL